MKRDACPSGAEEPRKSPCSLPRSRPSYCASAVMSLWLNLLQHPREHLVLHLRGLADEVPLLLALEALRRSTNSVASTNLALPASSRSLRATNLCGMAPLPIHPMVRWPRRLSSSATSSAWYSSV